MRNRFWQNPFFPKSLLCELGRNMLQNTGSAQQQRAVFASGSGTPPGGSGGPEGGQPPDTETPENTTPPTGPEAANAANNPEGGTPPVAPSPIEAVQSGISEQATAITDALEGEAEQRRKATFELLEGVKSSSVKNKERAKEIAERLKTYHAEIKILADEEKKLSQNTVRILDRLLAEKKIDAKERKELFALDLEDKEFLPEWEGQLRKGHITADELTTIKKEEYSSKNLEKRIAEVNRGYSELMAEAVDNINKAAYQKRAVERFGRRIGLPLQKDRTYHFTSYRNVTKDGVTVKEPVHARIDIKDVFFKEDNDIIEDGKKVGKMPNLMPYLAIKVKGTPDNDAPDIIDAETFKQLVEKHNITEVFNEDPDNPDHREEIQSLSEALTASEGFEIDIKEGDEFEYRVYSDEKTKGSPNKKVQIIHIHKKDGKTYIELDQNVVISSHGPQIGKSTGQRIGKSLTPGEFARWHRRVNAVKPITFEQLKEALKEEAKTRNKKYSGRKSKQYPPIEVEPNEALYFDTDPQQNFTITEVDPDKGTIKLNTGGEYTPATFLSWVRQNEVEKKLPQKGDKAAGPAGADGKPLDADAAAAAAGIPPIQPAKNPAVADDQLHSEASGSALGQLWNNTYVLSLGDLYEAGKQLLEIGKRWLERKQKNRIGAIGHKALPGFVGAEFKGIQQESENARVQQFMKAYEQYGYGDLYDQLRITKDKDELKAILQCMTTKGWAKWSDPVMLAAIHRVGQKVDNTFILKTFDEEKLTEILDAFWGQGSYLDFKQKNASAYGTKKNAEKELATAFETDPDGRNVKVRMQELLVRHLSGEWVDPAQYEGYLEFAIASGKLTFADKVYFFIMGIGAAAPPGSDFPGRTLMGIERIGRMAASDGILAKYPIIEYFAASEHDLRDKEGNVTGERGRIDTNTFRHFVRELIEGEVGSIYDLTRDQFTPTQKLQDFIDRVIMVDPKTKVRVLKSSGDVSRWDHDDFHELAPLLGEDQIEQLTGIAGGAQRATPAAIKNAIIGFNHAIGIDLEEYDSAVRGGDMTNANKHLSSTFQRIYSFEKLHAILDDRYHHGVHDRTRLGAALKDYAEWDKSRHVTKHIEEINSFMAALIEAMVKANPDEYSQIKTTWEFITTKQSSRDAQQKQGEAIKGFPKTFDDAMDAFTKDQGPGKVHQIIMGIQGVGEQKTRLMKGIMARPQNKDIEKMENEQYKIGDAAEMLTKARVTVAAIENLERAAAGTTPPTKEQLAARESTKLQNLIARVKKGGYVSEADIAALRGLEEKLRTQTGQTGFGGATGGTTGDGT